MYVENAADCDHHIIIKRMNTACAAGQQVPGWHCRIASRCSLRYLSAFTGAYSQPACLRRVMSQAVAASASGAGTASSTLQTRLAALVCGRVTLAASAIHLQGKDKLAR